MDEFQAMVTQEYFMSLPYKERVAFLAKFDKDVAGSIYKKRHAALRLLYFMRNNLYG